MAHGSRIEYQPALDGVRAVAVAVVLLFHAGVPGFSGGYLGVSVFFTLSGYLITSLLVHEQQATGAIDLTRFYARRLRRLLPASLMCLLGVVAIAALTDLFEGVAGLRNQVLGAVFQVANWVFLFGDGSYQDLLARDAGATSPLEHFWSLAIEEQFYWVWPLFMVWLLPRVPRRRGRVVVVGALTAIAAAAAPVTASIWGADAAYWATPARLSEILMGALLALVTIGRRAPSAPWWMAPVALTVLVVCVMTFPSSGGPAYSGWLPAIGAVSALLVFGLQVESPVKRALSIPAAVLIGKVSYGLYLFHWPVFVIVHPDRVEWSAPVLFLVRMAITVAITIASYQLIETPVRSGLRLTPRPTFALAGAGTLAVGALAAVAVSGPVGEYWRADAAAEAAASIDVTDEPLRSLRRTDAGTTTTTTVATTTTTTTTNATVGTIAAASPASTAPSTVPATSSASSEPVIDLEAFSDLARPVRILMTGDSTAQGFGTGLVNWAADNPHVAQVEIVAAPGCGLIPGGERRIGDSIEAPEGCEGWVDEFVYPAVERLQPDVVVVMVTSWDLVDRRWSGEALLTPFDAEFQSRLDDGYGEFTTTLDDLGVADVVFVRHPIPNPLWLDEVAAQEDPARHAVIYDLYDRLADDYPSVSAVALDRWFDQQGLADSQEVRPDGIHPTPEAATMVGTDYLGVQLVAIALEPAPT